MPDFSAFFSKMSLLILSCRMRRPRQGPYCQSRQRLWTSLFYMEMIWFQTVSSLESSWVENWGFKQAGKLIYQAQNLIERFIY